MLLVPLFLGFLLVFITTLVSASHQPASPLPPAVPPEPYPNSDVYPAQVYLAMQQDLQILYHLQIDIEGLKDLDNNPPSPGEPFKPSIATIYIDAAQARLLSQAGLDIVPIPNEGYRSFLAYGPDSSTLDPWPQFDQYVWRMQALEIAHPDIVALVKIGDSVQGRGLYCMQISDNPDLDENEPEFKYTANHHGDETTGIEMTMRLAELLANGYGMDPTMTDMVDKMEIWLCPIYNPDGYVVGTRYNAHGKDLNRDFPDRFTDPVDDPTGREPETQAFMNFGYAHRFVMGANYHGGAQVLNYPWDAVAAPSDPIIPDYAPDDQLFYNFGLGYTSRNPDLWNGGFENGITRGWEWYQIWGGMQDWAYYYHGEHHVTLEISFTKFPPFEQMDTFWDHNRDAMIWWIQRIWTGLGGVVLDARDNAPLDATITILNREVPNTIQTDPAIGDYHRVISEGIYTLEASAAGYQDQVMDVSVISGTLSSQDFYLCPQDTWVVSGTVTDANTGLPLQSSIEFLGSHQVTTSNPANGHYSIDICPSSYTMRVSAPWYYPEERLVSIDHSQIQDFPLIKTPNLSLSTKKATSTIVLPEDVIQYQLEVINSGISTTVSVTDTLPISLTWTGELTATQGIPIFEAGNILWQGEVAPTQPVTITYTASVKPCLPSDTTILNVAEFDDGISGIITGKVQLLVANDHPSLPSNPMPGNAAVYLPLNTTLAWAPSTDLNCDSITYDIAFGTSPTPSIVAAGLTDPAYDPGSLLPGRMYYWHVIAQDGITQIQGPIWRFSTLSSRMYLPMTIR